MSVFAFGRYLLRDEDPAAWIPDAVVPIDPYDGFSDQELARGEALSVILDEGQLRLADATPDTCRAAGRKIREATFITGEGVETHQLRVITRRTLDDALSETTVPTTDDGIEQVGRYSDLFQRSASTKARFSAEGRRPYRYRFDSTLPTVSTVRSALEHGTAGQGPICVGGGASTQRTLPTHMPVIVEKLPIAGTVRVIAVGDFHTLGCRAFHLRDVDAYETAALRAQAASTASEEFDFWASILS